MILKNLFPEGKTRVITFSYDDGRDEDQLFIDILNRYKLKGTFNLNSAFLDRAGYVTVDEVKTLYVGHEVATHLCHHPYPDLTDSVQLYPEVYEDRKKLETLTGGLVRGHAYPYGRYNAETIAVLKSCGIAYARTTRKNENPFEMIKDPYRISPSCHHRDALELADRYIKDLHVTHAHPLFFIWGHSYEFERDKTWTLIEDLCGKLSGLPEVWYSTNIELIDYLHSLNELIVSADGQTLYNPSVLPVWVSVFDENSIKKEYQPVKIGSGETVHLRDL